MKQHVLSVQNLVTNLAGKSILKDVGFTANEGEFIGIIGPNGAGKSTLLKSIRGLIAAEGGSVKILGQNIRGMKDKHIAKWIAYMQQEINLEFGVTALDVVLAGRYPYIDWWQNENKEDIAIARKYMAFTGVEQFAEKSLRDVSGGERQRILLAKVLAQETPLIFLDEPTASLDLRYQEEIFRYCSSVCQEERAAKTILMVVHDIRMAAKFCSRLILMADGEIVADGRPEEVVTAQNLKQAYGLDAVVFKNTVSGCLDLHTYRRSENAKGIVHILGHGDGAAKWIRELFEQGYGLSGGVFCRGEINAQLVDVFNVRAKVVDGCTAIDGPMLTAAKERQSLANWTLLPCLHYTQQNLYLLNLALTAETLWVIEDEPIEERDFSGGEAAELYKKILQKPHVQVFSGAKFLRYLQKNY